MVHDRVARYLRRVAGHVFVSYSRSDGEYVRSLVRYLTSAGIEVWTDDGIDHGDRWMETIRDRIDSCGAFIPVMTPSAESSTWVEREIIRADEMGKPILPLLLSGKPFFQLSHVQHEDVSGREMPSRRYLERLGEVLGLDSPIVVPPPQPQPAPSRPSTSSRPSPPSMLSPAYVPRPYRRTRRCWSTAWRALWVLAVGESWMSNRSRVRLAVTRLALLAVVVVAIMTFAPLADATAVDRLLWLSAIGPAAVACAGAAARREWMFSTWVAMVIAGRWAVELTSIPSEAANLVMALVLGILVVGNRSHHWPRALLFRTFAVVASIVVAVDWAYQGLSEEHDWWPALLDQLRWFLPSIAVLAQLSWEDDRGARRVSGAMVATFGAVFVTWAALSLTGSPSDVAATTTHWLMEIAGGLVLLIGGVTALRYRRYAY